jgi:hypothetical protein
MSKKDKIKFNIPDPQLVSSELPGNQKYTFGNNTSNLNEIKKCKPIFAFDYLSLENSIYCFNSSLLSGQKDYHKLLDGLKTISSKSYDQLSKDYKFHFHDVEFNDDLSISYSTFLKRIVADLTKVDPDKGPSVYQFKIFEEARIFGFIHNSVFYLVFFDRNHNAYKRK